jgi:hypothetical protein
MHDSEWIGYPLESVAQETGRGRGRQQPTLNVGQFDRDMGMPRTSPCPESKGAGG